MCPIPRSDLVQFIRVARLQGASDELLSKLLRELRAGPQREVEGEPSSRCI